MKIPHKTISDFYENLTDFLIYKKVDIIKRIVHIDKNGSFEN